MIINWTMKLWLIPFWGLIGFLLGGGPAFGAPQPQTPLLQLPIADFDFGELAEGVTVTHAFIVKNTGSEVLKIIDVRPG
jgi:hypothetical protein